jgi:hypothetical protein
MCSPYLNIETAKKNLEKIGGKYGKKEDICRWHFLCDFLVRFGQIAIFGSAPWTLNTAPPII